MLPDMLFLLALALLLLGPRKLPEVARQLGRWRGELNRAKDGLLDQLQQETAPAAPAPPTPTGAALEGEAFVRAALDRGISPVQRQGVHGGQAAPAVEQTSAL